MAIQHSTVLCFFLFSLANCFDLHTNAQVIFNLSCEASICRDYEVAAFITEIEEAFEINAHLVKIWRHDVSLILCSDKAIIPILNQIEHSESFVGVHVGPIRFGTPCEIYQEASSSQILLQTEPNQNSLPFSFF